MLESFRENRLKTTRRYYSINEFGDEINQYDLFISGSDQVLNPNFTTHGEDGKPSSAYWLNFGRKDMKRLGYAVSFGCIDYPENAKQEAMKWVNNFAAIGVREQTGLDILDNLGYKGLKKVLPDPTLLLGKELFHKLGIDLTNGHKEYTCVYMLRKEIKLSGNVHYIDEKHRPLTMNQWIQTIVNANNIITNSYHGMIIAILAHVPFAILLETGSSSGMNDRFYTLLAEVGVKDRLATTIDAAISVLQRPIDFAILDVAINKYRLEGEKYLRGNINYDNEG